MNTVNGLSFYESINKLIVGFLLLSLFVRLDSQYQEISVSLFLIFAYIAGCIYQVIVRTLTKSCLNLKESDLAKEYKKINKKECAIEEVRESYLKAYYKISEAGLLMNIPINEALENFMRNLIPIMASYEIAVLSNFGNYTFLLDNKGANAFPDFVDFPN